MKKGEKMQIDVNSSSKMFFFFFSKSSNFVYFEPYALVQISPVCDPKIYQIVNHVNGDLNLPVSAFPTVARKCSIG